MSNELKRQVALLSDVVEKLRRSVDKLPDQPSERYRVKQVLPHSSVFGGDGPAVYDITDSETGERAFADSILFATRIAHALESRP